ncbi:MAG: hypothetical protein Q4G30_07650 [Actinomycetaceae bacterium]|nr:hypothetical protein [Actinomycetaceae bacterium]
MSMDSARRPQVGAIKTYPARQSVKTIRKKKRYSSKHWVIGITSFLLGMILVVGAMAGEGRGKVDPSERHGGILFTRFPSPIPTDSDTRPFFDPNAPLERPSPIFSTPEPASPTPEAPSPEPPVVTQEGLVPDPNNAPSVSSASFGLAEGGTQQAAIHAQSGGIGVGLLVPLRMPAAPTIPDPPSVTVLGVSNLRWDMRPPDLQTPALDALLSQGSSANLVVRSVNLKTCEVDGWLTLSAGRRAAQSTGTCPEIAPPSGAQNVPNWDSFLASASAAQSDVRVGTLGQTLSDAHIPLHAVGAGAAIAIATSDGAISGKYLEADSAASEGGDVPPFFFVR